MVLCQGATFLSHAVATMYLEQATFLLCWVELLTAGNLTESTKSHENIYAFCPREFNSWN